MLLDLSAAFDTVDQDTVDQHTVDQHTVDHRLLFNWQPMDKKT